MEAKGLNYLDAEKPRVVVFCGKGGVGKTTCAATTALHFSKGGLRTLLISTDPTPSLSDMFEANVKGTVTRVEGIGNLDAVELDYELIVKKWKEKFGHEVYEVLSSFLPVDEEIMDYIAGAPGIDEEFALSYVLDFYENDSYDVIVWDTAPAGGTLSLLKLQDKFYRHLGEAARLYVRVRGALEALIKGTAKRDPLLVIAEWENLAKRVLNMLRDKRTHAIIVTIAEALGVRQTERVINELEAFGMHISMVLVNYLISEDVCTCDFLSQRASMQRQYLNMLRELCDKTIGIATLQQLPHEVKGVEAIGKVEKLLFE